MVSGMEVVAVLMIWALHGGQGEAGRMEAQEPVQLFHEIVV